MAFAEGTTVPVAKTRAEIEVLVGKHGATQFGSAWMDDGRAAVSFACYGRLVRFTVRKPTLEEGHKKAPRRVKWHSVTDAQAKRWCEGEELRRWRVLLLSIKAKLELVSSGDVTFEEEFLAHIITADNMTVWESIQAAERSGQKMLAAVGASGR